MKRTAWIIIAVMFLVGSPALSQSMGLMNELQQEAAELNTPPEAKSEPVEMLDIGCGPCQDWIAARGWLEGKNEKKKGGYFFVQSDSAVISAAPGNDNYINSRQNAYAKAFLSAKGKIIEYLESEISKQVTFDQKKGEFTFEKQAAEEAAMPSEETALQEIKRKTLSLINATLDEKLEEKGVDPNADKAADEEKIEEIIDKVKNSSRFEEIISSSAQQQLKGVRRVFVQESVKEGEQGEICVVALYSPKTMALADAIFTDPSLAPTGTPNKPVKEQLPNWRKPEGVTELLSTFGTEMLRDENGEFHLIAFAQSSLDSKDKMDQIAALKSAKMRAQGEITSFAREYAVFNSAQENSESAKILADAMRNREYESNNAWEQKLQSISKNVKISGFTEIGHWGAKHPLTGQWVVGSIVKWSPSDASSARELKAEMESTAKARPKSASGQGSRLKNDSVNAKGSYSGSASGGSSEEDF